jgi:uncharacterized membrane protein YfcA
MGSEFWFLFVAIAAIAMLAGLIHSAVGFGFGIVAISLLPLLVDAKTAHVVVSISSVPMLVMAGWAYREGIEWPSLKRALLGAVIFLPLGLWLFAAVSLDWLVRGTGAAILGMVLLSLRNQQPVHGGGGSAGSCFIAGATGGFLAGAVSIAGPPVAAFALRQDWSQARFKAFVTQCLLVIAVYKAVLLIAGGFFVGERIWQTIVLGAVAIPGVQLGVLVSRRISPIRFKRLVAVALILVSLMMMWRGQGNRDQQTSSRPGPPLRLGSTGLVDPQHKSTRGSAAVQFAWHAECWQRAPAARYR